MFFISGWSSSPSWSWFRYFKVIEIPVLVQGCHLAVWTPDQNHSQQRLGRGQRSVVTRDRSRTFMLDTLSLHRDRSTHLPTYTTTCFILRSPDNWVTSTLWGRLSNIIENFRISDPWVKLYPFMLVVFDTKITDKHPFHILDAWRDGYSSSALSRNPNTQCQHFTKSTSEPWLLPHQLETAPSSSSQAALPLQGWIWKEHPSFRHGHTQASLTSQPV